VVKYLKNRTVHGTTVHQKYTHVCVSRPNKQTRKERMRTVKKHTVHIHKHVTTSSGKAVALERAAQRSTHKIFVMEVESGNV
jgi:hypothetical protein